MRSMFMRVGLALAVGSTWVATASAGPLGPHGADWTGVTHFEASGVLDDYNFDSIWTQYVFMTDYTTDFFGLGTYKVTLNTASTIEVYLDPIGEYHYDEYDAAGNNIFGDNGANYFSVADKKQVGGFTTAYFTVSQGSLHCCWAWPPGSTVSTESWGRGWLNVYINYEREHIGSAWTLSVDKLPIPEPASWAMLISGLGLAGAMLRCRRLPMSAQ